MKKNLFILVSILTTFVLLFTACAPAAQPTAAPAAPAAAAPATAVPAAPAAPTTAAAAPAAGSATTIRVLTMQQAGPTPEEMDAIAAEFNKANPSLKVEIEICIL